MSIVGRTLTSALVAALLGACSSPADDHAAMDPPATRMAESVPPPTQPIDELTLHQDQFCPARLPRAPKETHGFGTDERATSLPTLPDIDEAWICAYETRDISRRGAPGAWYEWVRFGPPRQLTSDQVSFVLAQVDELDLIEGDYSCHLDLGARYLISAAWRRDLTGIVVDDYGCGSVRLSDDPFVTVPGDAAQAGTVPGVLQPSKPFLRALGVGRDR